MTSASRVGLMIPPHEYSSQGARPSRFINKRLEKLACSWQIGLLHTADVAVNVVPLFGIGSLTKVAPTAGGFWDDSASALSKFTSDLTDINDAGTADVTWPASEAVDDKLILGFAALPFGLLATYTSGTAAVGGTGAWQYLARNGTWTNFAKVLDDTAGFTTAAAAINVQWQIPDDWCLMVETEIDTTERYYVAYKVTTAFSTNPVLDKIEGYSVEASKVAQAAIAPATGVIDYIQYSCTAAGTANDTILQVLNHTRSTRGLVTITKTIDRGRFAFSTPLFVDRGDEITFSLVQADGTTEMLNWSQLTLEIAQ